MHDLCPLLGIDIIVGYPLTVVANEKNKIYIYDYLFLMKKSV